MQHLPVGYTENLDERLNQQKFVHNLLLFFNSNISGSAICTTETQSHMYGFLRTLIFDHVLPLLAILGDLFLSYLDVEDF